jgi:hypothetical protein
MTMNSDAIEHIAARTLAHYEHHADEFWQGTRDHDVSQNIAALLHYIEAPPPFELLDFGCGPGRDLKTFQELGHHPTGLEGAQRLEMAPVRLHARTLNFETSFVRLHYGTPNFEIPFVRLPRWCPNFTVKKLTGGILIFGQAAISCNLTFYQVPQLH